MNKYLLTGVAGFIASRTAQLLLEQGHQIVGIDSINNAYDQRLKHWRLSQLRNRPGFSFEQVDICDRPALEAIWEQYGPFDAVINLAARAGVRQSVIDPWVYFETNTTGTLNLLELCRQSGVKKFVVASSSSLYGQGNPMPYSEDTDTDRPVSPYAASKKAAEALCYSYHHLHGIDVSALRYFTVYGPAGRPDMSIFRFVQWIAEGRPVTIYGDGSQSRDFTFVDDIARGTIAALRPLGYEIINLGSDRPLPLMQLVRTIEDKLGKKAALDFKPAHSADVQATWANVSKARALLDWHSQVSFEEGVQRTVDWYLAEREWAKDIET